jgi:hypothetical protein
MNYLNSAFNVLRSNDSLVITIRSKAKYIFHTSPILLLYILRNKHPNFSLSLSNLLLQL